MGKKLAIRGHSTRGKEVIELLKMMGGTNPFSNNGELLGNKENCYYYISKNAPSKYISWDYIGPEEIDKYVIFTLEEFFRKYPFKVGDKVIDLKTNKIAEVYKMHWSENTNCVYYNIKYPNNCGCQRRLMDLKSMDDNHTESSKMKNVLAELLEHIKNTSKEELEKEFNELEEWSNIGPTVEEFMTFCECVNKKPVYPTTCEECCEIIHSDPNFYIDTHLYSGTLETLYKLLICRTAYWKIAGEEMGLNKPWEPDWNYINRKFYCIYNSKNNIVKGDIYSQNKILAFPTEEMRDTFYENFKDLIEQCKELL